MLTAAATLHVHGITDIQTSAQAAEALRPIAGEWAFVLFAAGILGTGMLAIPVLAGSAAYAVAEVLHWKSGMSFQAGEAKGYYAIIVAATQLGVILAFADISPMQLLLLSAMINGGVSVPLMAAMVHLADQPEIMGAFTLTQRHKVLAWVATAVMGISVLLLVIASYR
jgi:Mn2+/Fe2+ NRAMP family transporter